VATENGPAKLLRATATAKSLAATPKLRRDLANSASCSSHIAAWSRIQAIVKDSNLNIGRDAVVAVQYRIGDDLVQRLRGVLHLQQPNLALSA
jgi:hypothetical protein